MVFKVLCISALVAVVVAQHHHHGPAHSSVHITRHDGPAHIVKHEVHGHGHGHHGHHGHARSHIHVSRHDGPEHKVDHHEHHVDYHSHPKYEFEYKVEDPHTHDHKMQQEHRDGDVVKGRYSLLQPDGHTRHVEYYADKTGFHADVKYTTHHEKPHHH